MDSEPFVEPPTLPLTEHLANLIAWIQSVATGEVSLQQFGHDIYWSPILRHPPFLLAFLLCTLIPLMFYIDNIGKSVPGEKKGKIAKKETKKTQ